MYAYIKGPIIYKNPTYVVIEAGSIGYQINISLQTYAKIEKLEEVRLLTYLHVREDAHLLFGFYDDEERSYFQHLISVSGIGTNTARIILSSMTCDDIRLAIVGENIAAFKHVKGVGPKTAKQIILDLKDKIVKDGGTSASTLISQTTESGIMQEEAFSALLALGFARPKVQIVLSKIIKEEGGLAIEDLIKKAIKQLAS
ncbi:MAG: Holliday junction branch migration protein RuvA [Saprospiraceae bacterium]|jgi:Holliday junction DNA helicase RuvA|nr:Holliday junction branch migration protein RuvA [Saprospiraceae bacterium]MBL0293004.1 Holliday junction branch migration protein RuvA [Saprospiraceae bacterium]